MINFDEFGAVTDSRDRNCLVGRAVVAEYHGGDGRVHRNGRIAEINGTRWFGIVFDDYSAFGRLIVVDMTRSEFTLPRARAAGPGRLS